MEIHNNNINFGAKSIYPMMIKKITKTGLKSVKADFAELSVNSKIDKNCVMELKENWKLAKSENNYICNVANNYRNDYSFFSEPEYKYFIVRLKNAKGKMHEKVAAIFSAKPNYAEKTLYLDCIQSASQIQSNTNIPKTKGAGELSILGLIKYAKENFFKKITLVSTNDNFYNKLGFTKIIKTSPRNLLDTSPDYYLDAKQFDSFIKKLEDKYNIK